MVNKLTEKERLYYNILKAQSGTLYLTSEPGSGKSSILRHMAEVLGWQYKDIRLAMIDPISVGQFPYTRNINNIQVMDFAVPRWAVESNERPTLVHFEELNRAPEDVRKAAMQLFCERGIGDKFKFNNNVYLVATGNLGKEDNTDVEEFDAALNNRLIHIKHKLSVKEWLNWGKDIIHPAILGYIESERGAVLFDNDVQLRQEAYATPRTWHMLSNYIVTNYGIDSEVKEFLKDITIISEFYIGRSAKGFINYCKHLEEISLSDVLNMNDEFKKKLENIKNNNNTFIFMNIIRKLINLDISQITDEQCLNISTFLTYCPEEQVATYMNNYTKNESLDDKELNKYKIIFSTNHKNLLKKVSEYLMEN